MSPEHIPVPNLDEEVEEGSPEGQPEGSAEDADEDMDSEEDIEGEFDEEAAEEEGPPELRVPPDPDYEVYEVVHLYKKHKGSTMKLWGDLRYLDYDQARQPRVYWRRLVILAQAYLDGRVALKATTIRTIKMGRRRMLNNKKPIIGNWNTRWPIPEAPELP